MRQTQHGVALGAGVSEAIVAVVGNVVGVHDAEVVVRRRVALVGVVAVRIVGAVAQWAAGRGALAGGGGGSAEGRQRRVAVAVEGRGTLLLVVAASRGSSLRERRLWCRGVAGVHGVDARLTGVLVGDVVGDASHAAGGGIAKVVGAWCYTPVAVGAVGGRVGRVRVVGVGIVVMLLLVVLIGCVPILALTLALRLCVVAVVLALSSELLKLGLGMGLLVVIALGRIVLLLRLLIWVRVRVVHGAGRRPGGGAMVVVVEGLPLAVGWIVVILVATHCLGFRLG